MNSLLSASEVLQAFIFGGRSVGRNKWKVGRG